MQFLKRGAAVGVFVCVGNLEFTFCRFELQVE